MKPMQRGDLMKPPMSHPLVDNGTHDEVWMNDKYEVLVSRDIKPGDRMSGCPEGGDFPPVTWLSIKRRDIKDCSRDWRDFQEIKNDICGVEAEGVELFPAESRKMDAANQFHIWVLMPPHGFPFGYSHRAVDADVSGAAKRAGGKQRPFGDSRYNEDPGEAGHYISDEDFLKSLGVVSKDLIDTLPEMDKFINPLLSKLKNINTADDAYKKED